jgi:hypothetical protein
VPKLSVNFEEILLRADRNSGVQNKVLESFIIINNYCINIRAYHNYIITHNIIIILEIKASSKNGIRKKMLQ